MVSQSVKVPREALVERLTCSICNKLFRDATTISECLHTFCRKCIYKKLTDEELDYCPKCNINLGCAPEEKLRPDHILQDVRAKIFTFKRRKVNAPESMALIPLPVRRKERSLSSLVVSTPRVSTQSSMTGRRTTSFTRKAVGLRGSGLSIEKSTKEEIPMEGFPESSSSHETLSKFAHPKRKTHVNKHEKDDTINLKEEVDVWKPLNCLVDAANKTKFKSDVKLETPHAANNGACGPKGKVRKRSHKRHHDDDYGSTSTGLVRSKKSNKMGRKKTHASDELGTSAQAVLSLCGVQRDNSSPIWFKLVASEDQEGDKSLVQASSSYIRIKDSDIPVSFIQKYLMKKLDLSNEDEVEITCRGQPVDPTLKLYTLVDLWLPPEVRSKRVHASVGASAKDFLMVLAYRRKTQST